MRTFLRSYLWLLVAVALAAPSALRLTAWRSDLALWRAEVRSHPENLRGWVNIAATAFTLGLEDESIAASRQAIARSMDQRYHPWMRTFTAAVALTNASKILVRRGDYAGAEDAVMASLARIPEYPGSLYQRGVVIFMLDNSCAKALPWWTKAHELDATIKVPQCELVRR